MKKEKIYKGEITFDLKFIEREHDIIEETMKYATQISIRVENMPRVLSENLDMVNGTILDLIPQIDKRKS